MHILQVSFSDYAQGGGGAIAMYRLHESLKQSGMAGKILCGTKTLNSDESILVPPRFRGEHQLRRLTQKLGLNDIDRISSFHIQQMEAFQEADILNFHVIHSGFFNYLTIPKLTTTKPAVMTLHDMWAFTGHCAYSYDCDRWKTGCGRCPDLDSPPTVQRDNTRLEWRFKDWAYQHSQMAVVAPSRWLAGLAQQSMLGSLPIHLIPYGIDTTVFKPHDRAFCRDLLGIPQSKKVLMYSAANISDRRKGVDLLCQALQKLPDSLKTEIVLLVMGSQHRSVEQELSEFQVISLGYIEYEPIKAIAYSAADLFVFPTRADNLPLVLQESLACGTPIVSFKVGGVPDLVRPGITGYLAKSEDPQDFSQGLMTLLEDHALRQKLGENCRAIALSEYPIELQSRRYIEVYQQLLTASHS
jgi:glycosyltransferase involved in cell wall biosynthesis